MDMGMDTTQQHKQFLKNYNTKSPVRHQYDTGTAPIRHRYSPLNEASVLPSLYPSNGEKVLGSRRDLGDKGHPYVL